MKTETLQKAKEIESAISQLNREAIMSEKLLLDMAKEKQLFDEKVAFYEKQVSSCKYESDKLKKQLAELQDEKECVILCGQKLNQDQEILDQEIYKSILNFEAKNPDLLVDAVLFTFYKTPCYDLRVKVETHTMIKPTQS